MATETKKLTDDKMCSLLFWLCWITYFCTYIGRLNYNASITEILQAESITKAQAGFISTCSFFTYGIGQVCNGAICDRVSPKRMMFIGLTLSAAVNIFMGAAHTVRFMAVLWGINGFAQSMTWSPIIKLFSDYLPAQRRVKAAVNIATSCAIGTLTAYLLAAGCIALGSWRLTFFSAAVLMLCTATVWWFGVTRIERYSEQHGVAEHDSLSVSSGTFQNAVPFRRLMISSGMLIAACAVILHGILKDGVTTWVPTYISETFRIGSSASVVASTLLPVINLSGAYVASWLNRKWCKNEMLTAGVLFAAALLTLCCLIVFGNVNMILAVVLLSVTTSAMHGVNTMIISLIPLHFAKFGKVASATGLLNAFTYIGSAISGYGIGAVSGALGWNFTILIWIGIAFLGSILCILTTRRWARFKETTF